MYSQLPFISGGRLLHPQPVSKRKSKQFKVEGERIHKFQDPYFSQYVIKSRRLSWGGHTKIIEETRNVFKFFVGKSHGKMSLENLTPRYKK
jgi:hypothetical protein